MSRFFLEFYLDVERLNFLKKVLAIYFCCGIIRLKKRKKTSRKKRKEFQKMRVTKTVKEYIEKCVREKVYKKYEAEAAEAKRQKEEINNFIENLEDIMNEYIEKHIKMFVEEHPYAERVSREKLVSFYSPINIIGRHVISSVHNWRNRANAEVDEKVTDIVVTLELGGTKADLDRMLSEI